MNELADAYMVQHQQQQRQSNLITTPTAAAEANNFLRSESGRVSGFPFQKCFYVYKKSISVFEQQQQPLLHHFRPADAATAAAAASTSPTAIQEPPTPAAAATTTAATATRPISPLQGQAEHPAGAELSSSCSQQQQSTQILFS